MPNEKLKFMDMLSVMRVIDDDDRVRKFEDCVNFYDKLAERKEQLELIDNEIPF